MTVGNFLPSMSLYSGRWPFQLFSQRLNRLQLYPFKNFGDYFLLINLQSDTGSRKYLELLAKGKKGGFITHRIHNQSVCTLCGVVCPTPQMDRHLRGIKHRVRCEKMCDGSSPAMVTKRCEICKWTCDRTNYKKQYDVHLRSKRHKRMVWWTSGGGKN